MKESDQNLRVSIESPQSGWMAMSLQAGDQALAMSVSHQPADSLRDLIEMLSIVLAGGVGKVVRWNCAPDEYDFIFTNVGDKVQIIVAHYPDHRRKKSDAQIVFSLQDSALHVCLPFWTALRDLRRRVVVNEFARHWRREFPNDAMQRLTKTIKAAKRETNPLPFTT
jgi:hypothetical protein